LGSTAKQPEFHQDAEGNAVVKTGDGTDVMFLLPTVVEITAPLEPFDRTDQRQRIRQSRVFESTAGPPRRAAQFSDLSSISARDFGAVQVLGGAFLLPSRVAR
jgi:hypothetical protein